MERQDLTFGSFYKEKPELMGEDGKARSSSPAEFIARAKKDVKPSSKLFKNALTGAELACPALTEVVWCQNNEEKLPNH